MQGYKFVVLINFVVVLLLLIASIAAAILVYFQNFDFLQRELENVLKNYKNTRNATEPEDIFTATWDDFQIQVRWVANNSIWIKLNFDFCKDYCLVIRTVG